MSATWGVSYEAVAAAAETLVAAGQKASTRAVRDKVKGSMGTVQKHLNRWRETQREVVTTQLSLPNEIQRVILLEIEKAAAQAKATLEQDLGEAQNARDDLAEECERQAQRLEETTRELELKNAEAQQRQGLIAELRSEIEARKLEAAKAQADAKALVEAAKAEAQKAITEAEAETEDHRAAAETARTALAKAELRLEAMPRLEAELGRLQSENKVLTDERQHAREAAARAEARAEELAIYRGRAEVMERDLIATRQALAAAEKTAAVETERVRMLERSEAVTAKAHAAQIENLKSRIEAEESRCKALEGKLHETVQALGDEQIRSKALAEHLAEKRNPPEDSEGKPGIKKEAQAPGLTGPVSEKRRKLGEGLGTLLGLDKDGSPLDRPLFPDDDIGHPVS